MEHRQPQSPPRGRPAKRSRLNPSPPRLDEHALDGDVVSSIRKWPHRMMEPLQDIHVCLQVFGKDGTSSPPMPSMLQAACEKPGQGYPASNNPGEYSFAAFKSHFGLGEDGDESVLSFLLPVLGDGATTQSLPITSSVDWLKLLSAVKICGVPVPSPTKTPPYILEFRAEPTSYNTPSPDEGAIALPVRPAPQSDGQSPPSGAPAKEPSGAQVGGGLDEADDEDEASTTRQGQSPGHVSISSDEEEVKPSDGASAMVFISSDEEGEPVDEFSEGGEPVDEDSEEGDLSNDASVMDYMDEDTVGWPLGHVNDAAHQRILAHTCEFFGVSHTDMATKGFTHKVYGMREGLRPYQLWAVFWILSSKADRQMATTLLADDMGLGKTITSLAVAVISHTLVVRRSLIAEDRASSGITHLPADAVPGSPGRALACPLGTYRGGYQCPCIPGGWAARVAAELSTGPTLVVTPLHLMVNWHDQFGRFVDANSVSMQLVNLSAGSNRAMPDCKARVHTFEILKQQGKGPKRMTVTLLPRQGQSGLLLLLPSTSALLRIKKDTAIHHQLSPRRRESIPFGIQPGRIFVDELHAVKGRTTLQWSLIRDCFNRAAAPLYLTGLSGTPMSKDAGDLEVIVDLLNHPGAGWKTPLAPPGQCSAANLKTLIARQRAVLGKKGTQAFSDVSMAISAFLGPFTLRRTKEDKFEGHAILEVPACKYETDVCNTPAAHRHAVAGVFRDVRADLLHELAQRRQNWEDRGCPGTRPSLRALLDDAGRGAGTNRFKRLSLCGTFPAMSALFPRLEAEDWRFTGRDVEHVFKHGTPEEARDSQAWHSWADICRDSTKLERLRQLIERMLSDDEHWTGGVGNVPKKMLVYASQPLVAHIIFVWLVNTFPSINARIVDAGVTGSHRAEAFKPFELPPSPGTPDPADDPRILVTTMGIASTGLNLVRANYCVIVEPHWSENTHLQTFGRVHRDGAGLSPHLHFLFAADNQAESVIRNRQLNRSEMDTSIWEVSEANSNVT